MSDEPFYQSCIGYYFRQITHLPEFGKDFKKLFKRFRTLEEDIIILIKAELYAFHKLKSDNRGIVPIPSLGIDLPIIYKVTKIACRALSGRGVKSGLRVTYAYYEEEDRVELIEIYFKADQENEDRERIKRYYKK